MSQAASTGVSGDPGVQELEDDKGTIAQLHGVEPVAIASHALHVHHLDYTVSVQYRWDTES